MPQSMQRAAWTLASSSDGGSTNSCQCFTRSGTGAYLASIRLNSRNPVILPIRASCRESDRSCHAPGRSLRHHFTERGTTSSLGCLKAAVARFELCTRALRQIGERTLVFVRHDLLKLG